MKRWLPNFFFSNLSKSNPSLLTNEESPVIFQKTPKCKPWSTPGIPQEYQKLKIVHLASRVTVNRKKELFWSDSVLSVHFKYCCRIFSSDSSRLCGEWFWNENEEYVFNTISPVFLHLSSPNSTRGDTCFILTSLFPKFYKGGYLLYSYISLPQILQGGIPVIFLHLSSPNSMIFWVFLHKIRLRQRPKVFGGSLNFTESVSYLMRRSEIIPSHFFKD